MPRFRYRDPEAVNNGAERARPRDDIRTRVGPRIVRADLHKSRKAVGCNMLKEVYTDFRVQLYRHDISASEALSEFASLVAKTDPDAMRILERLARRKVNEKLAEAANKEKKNRLQLQKKRARLSLEEVDHDMLYGLIEERGQ